MGYLIRPIEADMGLGTKLKIHVYSKLIPKKIIWKLGCSCSLEEKYVNLFKWYEKIVDENPYKPQCIDLSCNPRYNYGRRLGRFYKPHAPLWKAYIRIGEANFSDHGLRANRLGASALMQGLVPMAIFVLLLTPWGDYLSIES